MSHRDARAAASPTGGQITTGAGQISQSGSTTTVQQSSQTLSLNWLSFNVGTQETVNFVQPNSSSLAVNRINSATGSEILGHLNANGQVWLINPNGVLFGEHAQVNVGGLVAPPSIWSATARPTRENSAVVVMERSPTRARSTRPREAMLPC